MAKFNKTMKLIMAIAFLTIVCASDMSTSYNTSSNATTLYRSSTLCGSIVDRIISGHLAGTLCAFGLIGNSLSFAVLHMYSSGNVGTFLFKALAVTDNLFLATAVGMLIFEQIYLCFLSIITKVVFALQRTTLSWTVWMMVIVAGNRYIAVCRPMMASRLCTIKIVQLEILIMIGVLCVFHIPQFLNLSFNFLLYIYAFHCIFVFLFPLAILIFFNVHLIRSLQLAQRRRMVMTSRSSNDGNNITIVMIVIIIAFVVCQAPLIVNTSIVVFAKPPYSFFIHDLIKYVGRLFLLINSSVNFVIYCVFRRQFRNQLCMLFGGVCGCPWQQHPARQPNDA